jgi:DNA-directed RNA polymerase subunit RPC12/RpoP
MEFNCRKCGILLKSSEEFAEKEKKCPNCGSIIIIPKLSNFSKKLTPDPYGKFSDFLCAFIFFVIFVVSYIIKIKNEGLYLVLLLFGTIIIWGFLQILFFIFWKLNRQCPNCLKKGCLTSVIEGVGITQIEKIICKKCKFKSDGNEIFPHKNICHQCNRKRSFNVIEYEIFNSDYFSFSYIYYKYKCKYCGSEKEDMEVTGEEYSENYCTRESIQKKLEYVSAQDSNCRKFFLKLYPEKFFCQKCNKKESFTFTLRKNCYLHLNDFYYFHSFKYNCQYCGEEKESKYSNLSVEYINQICCDVCSRQKVFKCISWNFNEDDTIFCKYKCTYCDNELDYLYQGMTDTS